MSEYHLAVSVRKPGTVLLLNVFLKFTGPFSRSVITQFRDEVAEEYSVS